MSTARVHLLTIGLCLALSTPLALAGGREPGSRLIFPVHHSGNHFTVLAVTNANLTPANQVQLGGTTLAHFEYYNTDHDDPSNPLLTTECSIHNDTENLTPADTFVVLTECHNAEDPGGQSGYVVVTARSPFTGEDWAFDWLAGSELVVNASGGVYSLNAVPFTAGGVVIPGDSMGYEPFPDTLLLDSFVALAGSQLSLTAFMEDPNDVATVQILAWNDNEQPMSSTFEMGCWFDAPLSVVSDMFTEDHLLGTGHDPAELDLSCNGVGTLETGWALIDCLKVETPSGLTVDPDGAPLLGAVTAGVDTMIDGGHNLWEMGDEIVDSEWLVVTGRNELADGVEMINLVNGEWFSAPGQQLSRLGGSADLVGGLIPQAAAGLQWHRLSAPPIFSPPPIQPLDELNWAGFSSNADITNMLPPPSNYGAQSGCDNWAKVIRQSDGAVAWAQGCFDFDWYSPAGHVVGDPQPILLDLPLYVMRPDGADFTLAEAVAAANP